MSRAEDAYRAQPVIMAVIGRLGLDVDALPWEESSDVPYYEVSIPMTRGLPSLHLSSRGTANIRWRAEDGTVAYELESDGYAIVTLEGRASPDTMLAAMAGMRLNRVVDMPGAEGMRIIEAVNSRAFISDPDSTRMGVEPIG